MLGIVQRLAAGTNPNAEVCGRPNSAPFAGKSLNFGIGNEFPTAETHRPDLASVNQTMNMASRDSEK